MTVKRGLIFSCPVSYTVRFQRLSMIVRLILISKCRSVHLNILYLLFRIFAPVCNICNTSITPVEGTDETVRVVAMEKDFHVDCYVCEVSIEYLLPTYSFFSIALVLSKGIEKWKSIYLLIKLWKYLILTRLISTNFKLI